MYNTEYYISFNTIKLFCNGIFFPVLETIKLAVLIKEKSILKSSLENETINLHLCPQNDEELDVISQFLASFDINAHFFDLTLPENTEDMTLLNFTKNIGKSGHKV